MTKYIFFVGIILTFFSSFVRGSDEKHTLIVCENGLERLDWDLEFIRHATQSIEISGSFCGGWVFRKILDEIEERLKSFPNLKVHILSSDMLLETKDKTRIAFLQKAYPKNFNLVLTIQQLAFLPDFGGIDNHVKCVIVDETYFSVGGTNLDEALCSDGTYTPSRNPDRDIIGEFLSPAGTRDMDIVGRGPIAKKLREDFYKLYALWDYSHSHTWFKVNPEAFAKNAFFFPCDPSERPFVELFETSDKRLEVDAIRFLFCGPHQNPNVISKEYERLIKGAVKEILIGNLYFNPVDYVLKAAMQAAARGVSLTLFTNGIFEKSAASAQFCAWANRINYLPILYGRHFWNYGKSKAEATPLCPTVIYEYQVPDVLFHKKSMVIDRHFVLVGSYNLGARSDNGDYEWAIVIESPEVAEAVYAIYDKDRAFSAKVDPKEARDWYFDPYIQFVASTQKKIHRFMNIPQADTEEEITDLLEKYHLDLSLGDSP